MIINVSALGINYGLASKLLRLHRRERFGFICGLAWDDDSLARDLLKAGLCSVNEACQKTGKPRSLFFKDELTVQQVEDAVLTPEVRAKIEGWIKKGMK